MVPSWVGYVNPDQCLGKPDASPRAPADPIDFDVLKAEVRGQVRDAGARAPIAAARTTQLGAVTGPDSPGRTDERWAVGGTDLGHPFVLDGRLGLVFGDTFALPQPSGPGWRSNVLGWVDDPTDQALTITQMPQAGPGRAAEVLGSLKIDGWERTAIPTDAVAIDGRILMHYMSIACWGVNAGRRTVGGLERPIRTVAHALPGRGPRWHRAAHRRRAHRTMEPCPARGLGRRHVAPRTQARGEAQ